MKTEDRRIRSPMDPNSLPATLKPLTLSPLKNRLWEDPWLVPPAILDSTMTSAWFSEGLCFQHLSFE